MSYFCHYFLNMILIKLLSRLPLFILYGISTLTYLVIYYIVGYRKKVVFNNIRNAFPDKNEKEVKALAKQFYKNFTDFIVEVLKEVTISKEELNKRVQFKNTEEVERFHSEGKSIVILATHQFNWEWALVAGCAQLPFPFDAIYKPLSNPKFEKLMYDTRSRFGGNPIPKDNALMEIMKTAKRLKAVAINADQVPTRQNKDLYWTKFLNQDTAFFSGSERIPKLTKYPVFFLGVRKVKRGYYEVELIKLGEAPYQKDGFGILDAYVKASEELILQDPTGWLWSHKRWKYKKPLYA
ncbi:MAG: lysophospholipid acyltransferase family protein [Bacteroidota bacterium]